MSSYAAAQAAAQVIADRLVVRAPAAALILGSGLGGLARRFLHARRLPFTEIPGMPAPGVSGHAGEVVVGTLGGREVLAFAGRIHVYEGHTAALAGFPVRIAHALGARLLFVANAAGGVRRTFRPGDLMIIADHLNLAFRNPLTGPRESPDERFPDMAQPYDRALRAGLRQAGEAAGVALQEGTYAWLTGPSYETPAEVRMLERLGADAVGMSTVPEVVVARALGLRVAGMSCVTNLASGLAVAKIHHHDVLETTARAARQFEQVIETWLRLLPNAVQPLPPDGAAVAAAGATPPAA